MSRLRGGARGICRELELGGACCVYHRGEKVVDLWGGVRTMRTGEPWEPDTYDECLKADGVQFSLGFMKSTPAWPFGGARSFGSPGAGGSLGFADPDSRIGDAYVTSQMGTALTGDSRDVALREALDSAPPLVKECTDS